MTDDAHEFPDAPPSMDPWLAGLDLRWLAAAVDAGLYAAVPVVGALVGGATGSGVPALGLAASAWLALVGLNAWLVVRDGQSIGKRWVDIRIVDHDGRIPTFFAGVVVRSWLVVLLFQVVGLWALLDSATVFFRDRRAVHDHLSATRVVLGAAPFRRRS